MARKDKTSKISKAKTPVSLPLVYKHQPAWGNLVKRRIALAQACAEAAATRNGPAGTSRGGVGTDALRRKLMEQAREVVTVEHHFGEDFVGLSGHPVKLPPTYIETYSIAPSQVDIGTYAVKPSGDLELVPSDLIYACPNDGTGHYWSAWFANGKVGLTRYGRLGILGPTFTGKIWVYLQALAQGIADIEPGGHVTLATGCGVSVWRRIDGDPNIKWLLVADASEGTAYPNVQTTTPGIVNLNSAQTQLELQVTDARPGDIVETRQDLSIVATCAAVQLGPNRSDCAAGGSYGFLQTPPPVLNVEYSNLQKLTDLMKGEALPLPHWARSSRTQ